MTHSETTNCLVCGAQLFGAPQGVPGVDADLYSCAQCGEFGLSGSAEIFLSPSLIKDPDKRAIVSHAIRQRQASGRRPMLDTGDLRRIIERGTLPNPAEQADNLIRWLGNNVQGPGEEVSVKPGTHQAIIGAKTPNGVTFILKALQEEGLITGNIVKSMGDPGEGFITLSYKGWKRFEELQRGTPSGRKAFMAMQFGDQELDGVVDRCFRPAVCETGFSLQRLDDEPRAGLIDARLRTEIRGARFLIVDLTHGNKGAYWEAGYGEGLGKPVIYTCKKSRFEEASHFDTNHHLTVHWDESDLKDAANRLKAIIRFTIPEANQGDEE